MNQIWQKFLVKNLQISKQLLAFANSFIKKTKDYTAKNYQLFDTAFEEIFGTMTKEKKLFSKALDDFLKLLTPLLYKAF